MIHVNKRYYHYPNRYDIWITKNSFNGHTGRRYERAERGKRPRIIAWTSKAACSGLWSITLRVGKTTSKKDCKVYKGKSDYDADKIVKTFIDSLSDIS